MSPNSTINPTWKALLAEEMLKPYFIELQNQLSKARKSGQIIYPKESEVYTALDKTPFDQVKVVIIGQDPYHRPDQAIGLCFSVSKKAKIPPSLRNIFKEIKNDLGYDMPTHGDLSSWAEQGVLMLNSILTVEEGKPGSHQKIGWINFTHKIIELLSERKEHIIFLLWGKYAQGKKAFINVERHYILEAAHPSPLARNKFANCKHFSKTNELLIQHEQQTINWEIK